MLKVFGDWSQGGGLQMNGELSFGDCARGWLGVTKEVPPTVIARDAISGQIPRELRGTFLRNGPGITGKYGVDLVHPIDGDGLVCGLSFSEGEVRFCSAFVATRQRQDEEAQGRFVYYGQMGSRPGPVVQQTLGFLSDRLFGASTGKPRIQYRNPSNTNVFYWGGKVISCYETAMPYALEPHSLRTLGSEKLGNHLKLGNLAAHFRIDPIKRSLLVMSLRPGVGRSPVVHFNEFDENWGHLWEKTLHIRGLNYGHDFLITPRYIILHMTPFVKITTKQALQIQMGLTSSGKSMRYYPDLPSRFIVIDRQSSGSPDVHRFFDTEPYHIFHFGNAFEEDAKIKFNAVCFGENFDMTFDHGVWLSNATTEPGYLREFELDLDPQVSQAYSYLGEATSCEFPTVHPWRHGQKSRFSYLMACDHPDRNLPFQDIVKYDREGSQRQVWHAPYCVGEPIFMPRTADANQPEDDGWLIVQAYDPRCHQTLFVILAAQDIAAGPVATIKLAEHLPFGFHGTYCAEVLF